jgi:hypothetical protein
MGKAKRIMEYFGTDLREAGHYRWDVGVESIYKNWKNLRDLPFDPERLTINMPKGECAFYQGGGFTVLAIAGSPVDKREGTKSVFWINDTITKEELIDLIKGNKAAMKLIKAMPFEVKI